MSYEKALYLTYYILFTLAFLHTPTSTDFEMQTFNKGRLEVLQLFPLASN